MLVKSERALQQYTEGFDPLSSFCLSNDSPSGVRYCVGVMGQRVSSVVAGTPVHTFWPPEREQMHRGQCLYPMNYSIYVQTGWCVDEVAQGMWNIEPDLCEVPASLVREALEVRREIRLLTEIVNREKKLYTKIKQPNKAIF